MNDYPLDIWKRKFAKDVIDSMAYIELRKIREENLDSLMVVDNDKINVGEEVTISKSDMIVGNNRMEITDEKGLYKCIKKQYGHIFLVKK